MKKPPGAGSYFHLHLISDATGETLLAVGRAAAAQYATVSPIEHVYPLIRNQKQLDVALTAIEQNPGIVLYTLVDRELASRIEARCRDFGVPCLSVLGSVLALFQSYLGAETTPRVGGQHMLNADYFRRIDALNFTMMHDDGQHVENLEESDVVLVGVSRTSKTPTSIYLANRGIRTANVPLVPGVPAPANLETLTRPLVVGLFASPERIVQVRQNRLLGLNAAQPDSTYVDRQAVSEEITLSKQLCARH
jgi:regulator of PEP synthase PpsR (kinase-PPPase family)